MLFFNTWQNDHEQDAQDSASE